MRQFLLNKSAVLVMSLLLTSVAFADPRHGDWIKNGEFKGKRILIACYYWEGQSTESGPLNFVPKVLRDLGFAVDILREPRHLPDLSKYDVGSSEVSSSA